MILAHKSFASPLHLPYLVVPCGLQLLANVAAHDACRTTLVRDHGKALMDTVMASDAFPHTAPSAAAASSAAMLLLRNAAFCPGLKPWVAAHDSVLELAAHQAVSLEANLHAAANAASALWVMVYTVSAKGLIVATDGNVSMGRFIPNCMRFRCRPLFVQ